MIISVYYYRLTQQKSFVHCLSVRTSIAWTVDSDPNAMQLCISASLVKLIRMPGSCLSMAICKENKLIFYYLKTRRCKHNTMYGTLQKSFHQVHEGSWAIHDGLRAVSDGSRTVHELVLYIGINGYKRCFWVLCAACEQVHELLWVALWASSQSVMSSFVSTEVRKPLWAASWVSSQTIMSSFTSSWAVTT